MNRLDAACEKILKLAGDTQCEVTAAASDSALTRFAENAVSQNVASSLARYSVRLLDNGRCAKVAFDQADDASLKRAMASAFDLLRSQKKEPGLLPLPKPKPLPAGADLYDPETAALTPAWRALKAAELARACARAGQTACGTVENGASERVIASSTGVFARHRDTYAVHSVTVKDGDGSGWAERYSWRAGEIPFSLVNETARAKAAASRRPRALKPGRYAVLLEPNAAAELVMMATAYGFGGQLYNEGRAYACGRLGKRVFGPLLTIVDNAVDGPAAGAPFDSEGMPKSKVTLVENGVLKAVVHDRKTAKKAGAASTGHALPQPSYMGPLPTNVAVKPGRGSFEDLIRATERAVLVTQFHYTNMLRPEALEMTGMTRNGTFLVEDGKIACPVKNMRFTQSLGEAFASADALCGEAPVVLGWGPIACPAMRLGSFNFSSATEF